MRSHMTAGTALYTAPPADQPRHGLSPMEVETLYRDEHDRVRRRKRYGQASASVRAERRWR
jgi:hypothetical protein